MGKLRKIMLLIPMLVFMAFVLPCEAKTEGETFEIELIDLGNGFEIPKDFKVMDENGNFGTLNMNLSNYDKEIIGEWKEVKLDNGYTARLGYTEEYRERKPDKEYRPVLGVSAGTGLTGYGWKEIIVKDENDELIYYAGLDPAEQKWVIKIKDKDGNMIENAYGRAVLMDGYWAYQIHGVDDSEEINQADPGYVQPIERSTYCEESKTTNSYIQYDRKEDDLRLYNSYEIDENGDKICKQYSLVYPDNENGEPKIEYSYKEKDTKTFALLQLTLANPLVHDSYVYDLQSFTLPTVITHYYNGEAIEYYIYMLTNYKEEGYSPEALEFVRANGMKEETWNYFTKEQIEILERENITDISDLREKYPEFLFPPMDIIYEGDFETPVDEAEEAIVSTPVIEEEEVEEGVVIGTQSNNVFNQPLTGDVVAINGMTPVAVLTFIENTPAGEQIKVQLVDDNYNTILTGMAFDTEHTKYKYAYLTVLDMSGEMMGSPFFQVAGTDSQVSGNLSHVGSEIYVGE